MDVRCERCRAPFGVDDARVPTAGLKVVCDRCGHRFLLRKRVLALAVPLRSADADGTVPLSRLAPAGNSTDLEAGEPGSLGAGATGRAGDADPAWVQGVETPDALPEGEPRRPPRSGRRLAWISLIALGLLAVSATTVLLRRQVEGDLVDGAARSPAPPADPPPSRTAVPPPAPPPPTLPVAAPPARESAEPANGTGTPSRSPLARARTLRDQGRCEEALELYGQLLARGGSNVAALAGRGACYLDLSRYAQAEASFEAALETDPRNPEALFGLAETYRYMGRKADALKGYEKFLDVRPTGDDATAARRLISQLKE